VHSPCDALRLIAVLVNYPQVAPPS
jgi:hypothetical protein